MSVLASEADRKGYFQEEKVTHPLLGVGKRHASQYPPTSQLCHLLQAGMILGLSSLQCPATHRAGARYVIAIGGFYISILSAGTFAPKTALIVLL